MRTSPMGRRPSRRPLEPRNDLGAASNDRRVLGRCPEARGLVDVRGHAPVESGEVDVGKTQHVREVREVGGLGDVLNVLSDLMKHLVVEPEPRAPGG